MRLNIYIISLSKYGPVVSNIVIQGLHRWPQIVNEKSFPKLNLVETNDVILQMCNSVP